MEDKSGLVHGLVHGKLGYTLKRIKDGEVGIDDGLDLLDDVNPLFSLAHKLVDSWRPQTCKVLTFQDVVAQVKQHMPEPKGAIVGCCALLEKDGNNIKVIFIYIDKNDEPVIGDETNPYGFYLLTKELDEELNDLFGGESMLVIR